MGYEPWILVLVASMDLGHAISESRKKAKVTEYLLLILRLGKIDVMSPRFFFQMFTRYCPKLKHSLTVRLPN